MRDYADERALAERAVPTTEAEQAERHAKWCPEPTHLARRCTSASVIGLQRQIGNAGTTKYLQREEDDGARSPVHSTISGGGSSLDGDTRSMMEGHLGADFSNVRLHVDAKSAESVQAAAYTVGNDVVVHPNHFQAGTPSAQRTLAHELTHVVQQRSGPVDGSPAPGGIKVSNPSDRFEREAESNATAFERKQSAPAAQAPQGEGQDGGDPVQRMVVQREEEKEDEGEE